MNITKTDIDALDALVTIQLEPQDYEPKVKESLKKIKKQSNIKGFRAGQVPVGYLKKMYGNQVLAEELGKLVNDNLNEYIEKEELKLIGRPVAAEDEQLKIDIKKNSNYDFKFYIGQRPEFEIDVLSSDSDTVFTSYNINVAEQDITKELEKLQSQHGEVQTVETIDNDDDALHFELVELDESVEPKEEGHTTNTNFLFNIIKDGDIKEQIRKLEVDHSVIFNVFDIFKKEEEQVLKFILNLEPEDGKEQVNPIFKATLKKVTRLIPADLNEDFIKKAFPDGNVDSVDTLKNNLTENLGSYYKNMSNQKLFNEVIDSIIAKTEIELPQKYIDSLLEQLKEDKRIENEELGRTIEEDNQLNKEDLERSIRWDLIKGKLITDNEIKVEKEELENAVKSNAIRNAMYYFGGQPPKEFIDQLTNQLMSNKEHVNETFNQVLDNKIAEVVLEKVNKSEEAIDFDAFKEL